MRDVIHSQILKSIYFAQSQSIAEISNSIGKSIPIVTKAVQQLLKENIILTNGLKASTGGRRANSYILNKEVFGAILCININRYSILFSLYNIANEEIIKPTEIEIDGLSDEDIYKHIIEQSRHIIENYSQTILCISITAPGFVDSLLRVNNSYPITSPLYNLANRMQEVFGTPTYIENDSSAIAIAEKNFSDVKNLKHVLVINLTWGVGLGILVDNQLFRGSNGYAGEFSHIPLANESKLCSCGKKGCIEVEASLESAIDYIDECLTAGEVSLMSQNFNSQHKTRTLKNLVRSYQAGDQLSIHAIKRIGYMLGKGIATLIHILNPNAVIISGIGAVFGRILLPEIQSAIQIYCIPRLAQPTTIKISTTPNIEPIAAVSIAVLQSKSLIKTKYK